MSLENKIEFSDFWKAYELREVLKKSLGYEPILYGTNISGETKFYVVMKDDDSNKVQC